jgi:hypothetical protein
MPREMLTNSAGFDKFSMVQILQSDLFPLNFLTPAHGGNKRGKKQSGKFLDARRLNGLAHLAQRWGQTLV